MKIYCLSGLGADEKAFQYLSPEGAEFIHIPWIDPLPKENMESYARRLYDENIREEEYNLMGLSFGGMLAQEFSKINQPNNLILLSTISSRKELPFYLKTAGAIRIHRLLPNNLIKSTNWITRYLFGTQDARVQKIFNDIQKDTDPKYIRWAISAILGWDNTEKIPGLRIHGERDKLLPKRFKVDHTIKNGGHLMLIDYADEVTKHINQQLKK